METVNFTAVPASTSVTKRDGGPGVASAMPASAPSDPLQPSASSGEPSKDDVDTAVAGIKAFAQRIERNLDFSVDDSTGRVVVKVLDGDSGDVIRQIPSEELLRLSERLEDMRSLLFQAKA